jgi:hydrogenase expression/formation protein HypD
LIELSKDPSNVIVTFGDMLHVTGSRQSLSDAKTDGADIEMVYSPDEMIAMAKLNPARTYIFAAVGFETTTPVYAMIIKEAIKSNIENIRILTSLKTMPEAINWVCENHGEIDGFIAPGHVSTITGSRLYEEIATKYNMPFAISGFTGSQILAAIASLVLHRRQDKVINLYNTFVTENGNETAQHIVNKYFEPGDATWRGFGKIKNSGMYLREEYEKYDAGSKNLSSDDSHNPKCRCAQVLTGEINPNQCPLFGRECTPSSQQGACMVSREGTCFHYFVNKRSDGGIL